MQGALGNPNGYMGYYGTPAGIGSGLNRSNPPYPTGITGMSRDPGGGFSPAMSGTAGEFFQSPGGYRMGYGWSNQANSATLTGGGSSLGRRFYKTTLIISECGAFPGSDRSRL